MIELTHLKEISKADRLPKEVQENIEGILSILDEEYGADRDQYKDNGGYVIVVEDESDFEIIKKKAHIDVDNVVVEYVDKIECSNEKNIYKLISFVQQWLFSIISNTFWNNT